MNRQGKGGPVPSGAYLVERWDGQENVIDWALSLPPAEPRKEESLIDLLTEHATVDARYVESPMELAMLDALIGCGFNTDKRKTGEARATLYHQWPVETTAGLFFLDFALIQHVAHRIVKLAIEVDGHAFHQATREQVEKDNRRTRALAKRGWIVVRYAGSEVNADAGRCALDAAAILIENVDRLVGGPS